MMYSMKEASTILGMTYEGLKFYCNQGLLPNVKRDAQNHRVFDDDDLRFLYGLSCLRKCGMGIQEMREYISLEMPDGIPARKAMLAEKEAALLAQLEEIQKSIDYIHHKQRFYDDILEGRTPDMTPFEVPAELFEHVKR